MMIRAWHEISVPSARVTMRYGSSARTALTSWGVRISTSKRFAWSTALRARSPPESPAGKPR